MRTSKTLLALLLAAGISASMLAGCQSDTQEIPEGEEPGQEAGIYTPGTYTGSAQGYGGEVTVTVEVDADSILSVTAAGEKETSGIGSNAIEQLPDAIKEAGSAEVDGVSGATITSDAVKSAAKAALAQARGESGSSTVPAMQAGTYTAYGTGFALCESIPVSVTVSENEILSIEVNMTENAETPPILDSVVELMIPRMIEHQSIAVDSICGATATSAGVKQAVSDCISQAITAAGGDGSDLSAFQVAPAKEGGNETLETDILVIGMGGSGTTAAMSAVENGAKVLAIDKTGKYGGTTSLTSEIMAINPPEIQAEHNNGQDWIDKAAMREAWLTYTEGDEKTEMVDILLDNSGSTLDWLVYDHGFEFDYVPKTGFTEADVYACKYQFLPNDIGANKAYINEYFDGIYNDFTEAGGQYLLETEAYELLVDDSGAVVGAKARNYVTGKEYTINAKAVILATGGFAGNAEMEEEYLSDEYFELKGVWCNYGLHTNDGKMIQNAIDLGAATYNIGMPPMVHNAGTPAFLPGFETVPVEGQMGARTGRPLVWSSGDMPLDMVVAKDSLAVDKHGNRFTDETQVAMLNSWISGPRYYSIWSNDRVEQIKNEGFTFAAEGPCTIYLGYQGAIPAGVPITNADEVMQAAIDAGIAYKADTLEDLAEQLGMDPATLTATVERYNGFCDSGVDEDFGKDPQYLTKIGSEGPYYAIVGAPYCYTTCGGLDINTSFQVLKEDGTVIPGLYAVGTDSMGVLFSPKKAYVTFGGAANGWAITSGKMAGEIVAQSVTA